MYFILQNVGANSPNDFYIDGTLFEESGAIAINIFNEGLPVADKVGKHLVIKLDENYSVLKRLNDRIVTRVQRSFYLLVVSKQMKKILQRTNPQNLEFIDLTIKGKELEITDYTIVNILSKIDCIDEEQSTVYHNSKTDKTIHAIYGIKIAEEKVPADIDIFLLDRHKGGIIVVHERLKDEIEKMELTGFKFIEPKEFAL